MSFKDVVAKDIAAVFLNTDENAGMHIIDGEEIACIIDEDKSNQTNTDGVYVVRRRLFVDQDSIGYRPVPGQKIEIDDQYFYVVDCLGEGLIEVILEARET